MNKDLTVGDPYKLLWKFCLPLFASVIFQQIYNITDSIVAGNFLGENALASVGNSYEVTLIFLAFATGLNIGTSVIVARFFGAKEYTKLKTTIHTSFIFTGFVLFILMVFGILFCDLLLNMIHTPQNIFSDSKLYLDIYLYGLPFLFYYNLSTGIFSALGDSKTPFFFLMISSISNIFMDIFFVANLHMGVEGVAIATFICQGVSCILSLIVIFNRMKEFESEEKAKIFSFNILKNILIISIPSTIQQSAISIGNIFIQSIINNFGASVIAGYSAAVKLNNLVTVSLVTVGNGITNYTSQNIGAKKFNRIKEGYISGFKILITLVIPIILIYNIFSRELISFFMKEASDSAINTGIQFLHIISPFYFLVALKFLSDAILKGSGLMFQFMIATVVDLVLRVILAFILSPSMGTVGIWVAWPISWFVAMSMTFYFYKHIDYQKITL